MLCIRRGWTSETVVIMDLCEQRGNATRAQALYTETSESMQVRAAEAARRKMEYAGLRVPAARPSKRDRRELRKLKEDAPP